MARWILLLALARAEVCPFESEGLHQLQARDLTSLEGSEDLSNQPKPSERCFT